MKVFNWISSFLKKDEYRPVIWVAYLNDKDKFLWAEKWIFSKMHGVGDSFIENRKGYIVTKVQKMGDTLYLISVREFRSL